MHNLWQVCVVIHNEKEYIRENSMGVILCYFLYGDGLRTKIEYAIESLGIIISKTNHQFLCRYYLVRR